MVAGKFTRLVLWPELGEKFSVWGSHLVKHRQWRSLYSQAGVHYCFDDAVVVVIG